MPSADRTLVEDKIVNILILEDDETLGLALKETLERAGYNVFLAINPDAADEIIGNHTVDFLFCDCLLPQMTGLDYVDRIGEVFPQARFKIILMSGIYTDRAFIQDAIRKTHAFAFLKKPFEVSKVLELVEREESTAISFSEAISRKNLYNIFAGPKTDDNQKVRALSAIGEVIGLDLPVFYSLLVETKISGVVKVHHPDGSILSISLCHGHIVAVEGIDEKTLLGEMLIQSGFCMPQDVEAALNDKGPMKIGAFLIESNRISPHALDLIQLEQMNMRLIKTLVSDKVRVKLMHSEVEMRTPAIDSELMSLFLHDWVASKMGLDWLKSLSLIWSNHLVLKSSAYRDDHPVLQMPLLKSLDGFSNKINGELTLTQILELKDYNETALHKAVYLMLIKGLLLFSPRELSLPPEEHLRSLKKIWASLEGKNEFQVMTYLDKCGVVYSDATGMKEQFYQIVGRQPDQKQSEAHNLWKKIVAVATDAIEVSLDSTKIGKMRDESQRKIADENLKIDALMEEIKKALILGQYAVANRHLTEVAKLNPDGNHYHLFRSWAKLGMPIESAKKNSMIVEVEMELMQVSPEERYEAVYSFVMGLLSKAKGHLISAKKSFEKSIALDSAFMPARRELAALSSLNKKQDVLTMDIKDVIGGFFKKK